MSTPTLRNRLRRDTGTDATSLPDADADAIMVEAAESYSGAAATAYARVLAIQGIMASAAKLASYRQNASSENASDVFAHLKQLLDVWEKRTEIADGQTDALFEVY